MAYDFGRPDYQEFVETQTAVSNAFAGLPATVLVRAGRQIAVDDLFPAKPRSDVRISSC